MSPGNEPGDGANLQGTVFSNLRSWCQVASFQLKINVSPYYGVISVPVVLASVALICFVGGWPDWVLQRRSILGEREFTGVPLTVAVFHRIGSGHLVTTAPGLSSSVQPIKIVLNKTVIPSTAIWPQKLPRTMCRRQHRFVCSLGMNNALGRRNLTITPSHSLLLR